ncbi:UNVERIFIED_CONTAM: hypothetical protein FKN15_050639 [Acipenser sinensis]
MPQCFSVFGALMSRASILLVPLCFSDSVLGPSAPSQTSMHQGSDILTADALGNNMSKIHPCKSCGGMLPPQDKHILCVRCLGMQHASICVASQPLTLRRRLAEFTGAASLASSAEPSAVLRPLLHLPSSQSKVIPCAQVSTHQACSRSRTPSRSTPLPAPAPVSSPSLPAVDNVSDRDKAMNEGDQDSLEQQETEVEEVTQETGPSSEIASETHVTPPSSSVRVLME